MKKVAVILSGCGFQDGAEITESVSVFVSLSQYNAEYKVFAPQINFQSSHPITNEPTESRCVLTESARLNRGNIKEWSKLDPNQFDALVIPGGFGVALHLSDWASKANQCEVHPQLETLIQKFNKASKPICAICIAPTLIAKVLGKKHISLTIGNNEETIAAIKKTGAYHIKCNIDDYVSDRENKIITTPAYMFPDARPYPVFTGINKAIKELIEMA